MSSRQLEEQAEAAFNHCVARELGLTYDELMSVDWSFDENEGNDGAIYSYIITFSKGTDPSLLAKVKGLSGTFAHISVNAFDEPDEDYFRD